MKKKAAPSPKRPAETGVPAIVDETALLTDLRELIQSAPVANATTAQLYWHLGRRLLTENLQDGRAAYGERILATVSRELTAEFGGGFGYATVNRAIQFAQFFPDPAIVSALSTQLSWSHFIELLPIKDPLARDFYAEMCRIERWDVRTLRQKKSVRLEGARDVMTHTPDAWVNNDATKIDSEVNFTRHSHKPPPLLCWNVRLRLSTERSQGGRAAYGRHFKRKLGALPDDAAPDTAEDDTDPSLESEADDEEPEA